MSDYYLQLREKADRFFAGVRARHPRSFACGAGCSACCRRHLTLFPVEADRVEEAVRRLPPEVQARLPREPGEDCPLLVDGLCSVYEDRPLICRTHGAPIRVEGRTDVCPLNFTGEDPPSGSVLDLDRLNEILVAVNVFHCRRKGTDPGARRSIVRIIASALEEDS